jgi:hypothetical protein
VGSPQESGLDLAVSSSTTPAYRISPNSMNLSYLSYRKLDCAVRELISRIVGSPGSRRKQGIKLFLEPMLWRYGKFPLLGWPWTARIISGLISSMSCSPASPDCGCCSPNQAPFHFLRARRCQQEEGSCDAARRGLMHGRRIRHGGKSHCGVSDGPFDAS